MNAAVLASIPSPDQGVWHLGPLPLRGYALCILIGIGLAIWICQIRWRARGGDPAVVLDIATWAVPFGVVGGRLYHVITSPQQYFGEGGDPVKALFIWEGGLGIWGAIALGGVGAWIAVRRRGILLPPFADALAPGLLIAQAFGRWGNWFNNELYGKPLAADNPFALKIYEWDTSTGQAIRDAAGDPVVKGYYEPTFLYECGWNLLAAVVILLVDRRFRLGHGRVFALYVMTYCIGRGYIETLRIDEANHILGLRLNVWTSIILFTAGLAYLLISSRLRPGRDASLYRPGHEPAGETPAATEPDSAQQADVTGPAAKPDGEEPSGKTPESTKASGEKPGEKDQPGGNGAVGEAEVAARKSGD
ncbi:prolipoprotein diacylglyceryl transferase [Kineosporia sp. J2-2]|uniref:Phosphatidylglycerol--prolipoprotein diacylglyceryl transferase n=1 Tax=Kineosporia corallincola TaxID=2835133 RepID=A0ABS5TCT2_9ACTN|nr:prolipoprotein diacylglyceryl transferase [Kineosporia corallincola]MBT0768887.1 prolipoprotein diacylglyceryl transferase [Kineosporia corallincola]